MDTSASGGERDGRACEHDWDYEPTRDGEGDAKRRCILCERTEILTVTVTARDHALLTR